MQHDWVRSTLGHGETMCRRCLITNREAAVLGWHECRALDDQPPIEETSDHFAIARAAEG